MNSLWLRYSNEEDDFDDIWFEFADKLKSLGFKTARPHSNNWYVHGEPWIYENHRGWQIWVYMVPQWEQKEVFGHESNHHSIYGHIQKHRILDKFELKPKTLSSLKSMVPKALNKIEDYLKMIPK
jgi:hypothetical protein